MQKRGGRGTSSAFGNIFGAPRSGKRGEAVLVRLVASAVWGIDGGKSGSGGASGRSGAEGADGCVVSGAP